MKRITLISFLTLSVLIVKGQQQKLLLEKITLRPADTNKITLLIKLGDSIFDYRYASLAARDSGYKFYKQALDFSTKLHEKVWQERSMERIAYSYNQHGDTTNSIAIERKFIAIYHQRNDPYQEAIAWQNVGQYTGNLKYARKCFETAKALFIKAGSQTGEIGAMKAIGDNLLQSNKLDSATLVLTEVIRRYKQVDYKKLHYAYDLLASISMIEGHLKDALFYREAVVKSMGETKDFRYAAIYYDGLADDYWLLGHYPQWLHRYTSHHGT